MINVKRKNLVYNIQAKQERQVLKNKNRSIFQV